MAGWDALSKKLFGKKNTWVVIAVCVLVLILFLRVGSRPLQARFNQGKKDMGMRLEMYKDCLSIAKDFPLFGVGLGNVSSAFPFYKSYLSPGFLMHAHNDHLQLLVESGIVGAGLCFLFFAVILVKILTILPKRHDPLVINVTAGGLCGLLGVTLHNCLDFSFHVPAVLFMFWVIWGLLFKLSRTHFFE